MRASTMLSMYPYFNLEIGKKPMRVWILIRDVSFHKADISRRCPCSYCNHFSCCKIRNAWVSTWVLKIRALWKTFWRHQWRHTSKQSRYKLTKFATAEVITIWTRTMTGDIWQNSTVWKFHNYSITQIFREINLQES